MKMVVLFLLLAGTTSAVAEPICVRPLAPTKAIALRIFEAVIAGQERPAIRRKYVADIQDDGNSWTAAQSLRGGDSYRQFKGPHGEAMEEVRMTEGGGGLEMRIDKCTAAISHVQFSR